MKGIYALDIIINQDIVVRIGALGEVLFIAGDYVYVGSALNSLEPRILRHLGKSMGAGINFHWHIDYLLVKREVEVRSIYITDTTVREECLLAEYVRLHGIPVKGFGSSDCKCSSHLFMVKEFSFLNIERDLPVLMGGITPTFSNDMEVSERREVDGDVALTVQGWMYRPIDAQKIIKQINSKFIISQFDESGEITPITASSYVINSSGDISGTPHI